MSSELIINASLPEIRIALIEEGQIHEILVERPSDRGIVGNIYKGRVTRVLPGMQAAFVDIGHERAAFLYVDDVYVHHPANQAQGQEDPTDYDAEPSPVSSEVASEETSEPTGEATSREAEDWDDNPEESGRDESGDDEEPVSMGPEDKPPPGTIAPDQKAEPEAVAGPVGPVGQVGAPPRRRGRRGHRGGGRGRNWGERGRERSDTGHPSTSNPPSGEPLPENFYQEVVDSGSRESDRTGMTAEGGATAASVQQGGRPAVESDPSSHGARFSGRVDRSGNPINRRPEFREHRSRDRQIRSKASMRPGRDRPQVNIEDLLKEGQEVLVQVAKEPIAQKGARLTCHISLPGRHLVCMPTIDHVGVSRRIERDDERRRLRDFVDRNRQPGLGFIVRTASGGKEPERWVQHDMEYLTWLWGEIKTRASSAAAPALVYEDLNSVLRAIRDWVNEDLNKIIVDSRFHYNEVKDFVARFMPLITDRVELYQGDIPIFDAYGISSELHRALERKVWLKSGGYIVIDQAEALVAIDVNTGRYVGKKNLEDTILKTNLEAVQEIAYQLRLRNCGGIIVLDFIDMEREENRHRVYRALDEALKHDRSRPTILKISELGLVEMTRKRTRDTMVRALCEPCSHCEGKGFIKSRQTVAFEVMREMEREGVDRNVTKILVQAHPDVIDMLAVDERQTLEQLERKYRKPIFLQAVLDLHPEQFEVSGESPGPRQYEPIGRDRTRHAGHYRGGGRAGHRGGDRSHPRRGPDERDHAPQPQPKIAGTPQATEPDLAPTEEGQQKGHQESQKILSDPVAAAPHGLTEVEPAVQRTSAPAADGFDSEEDRLAFLRAQAAQDAAIATLQSPGPSSGQGRGPGGGMGRGGMGPRGGGRPHQGRRGRRGGGGGGGGRRGPRSDSHSHR